MMDHQIMIQLLWYLVRMAIFQGLSVIFLFIFWKVHIDIRDDRTRYLLQIPRTTKHHVERNDLSSPSITCCVMIFYL